MIVEPMILSTGNTLMFPWHHGRFSWLISVFTLIALVCVPLLATPTPAHAATITVNSLADNGPGNCSSTCTLRDAIAIAVPLDDIHFSVNGTFTLSQGPITIGKNLTITGNGFGFTTIDGNHASSVFIVNSPAYVYLQGLDIVNGSASGYGGGISN